MPAPPSLTSRLPAATSALAHSRHPRPGRIAVRATLATLAVLALAAGACARGVETPDFRGTRASEAAPVQVDVRNLNYADVTIHASRDGAWHRIGQVTGNSNEMLEVPEGVGSPAGYLRLRVHAIGSPDATDFVTDGIMASRGDIVELRVAPVLRMSSWSVR
jgi:hypothetical protein